MKRTASTLTVVTLGLFAPACGLFAPQQTSIQAPSVAAASAPKSSEALLEAPADPRKVGDFYVHRFSGSYQKAPLTLTEEVVAQEGSLWVIDYTLEEQTNSTSLRVRFDPRTDSVVRVSKFDGKREISLPIASYEQLIERTSFAADSNDGLVASGHSTCLVGSIELDCETRTYDVRVGEKPARLNVSHSASIASGDVTGDITASDGTVIYRSELVEMGKADSARSGVASR
jgi:hypothetical protein